MHFHYKDGPLILSREIIAHYFENHAKHINEMCGQSAEL